MSKALETAMQADLNYIKDYNTKYSPTNAEIQEDTSALKKLYYKISNCDAILAQSYVASGLELDEYNRRFNMVQAVKNECLDAIRFMEKMERAQHKKYEGV